MRLWRGLKLPRAIKTVERMAPGIQYRDTGRRAPMIKRLLRHYKWLPKEGETWAEHAMRLREELHPTPPPEPEEPDPDVSEHELEPEPVLSELDRQLLRKKFKIPRGVPDPDWFEKIEPTS